MEKLAHVEAPDAENALAFALALASQGNVRTTTLRAFDADEMRGIIAKTGYKYLRLRPGTAGAANVPHASRFASDSPVAEYEIVVRRGRLLPKRRRPFLSARSRK